MPTKVYMKAREVGTLPPLASGHQCFHLRQERDPDEIWDSAPFYPKPRLAPRSQPPVPVAQRSFALRVKRPGGSIGAVRRSTMSEVLALVRRLPKGTEYSINSLRDWRTS